MYERQEGTGLEIGSYAHRPITLDADEIPIDRGGRADADRAAVHPGGLRPADGDRARADARDRRRRDRRREVRDQRRAVGDLDGMPLLGETPGGQGPVVGGRDLDQGGPGRRQDGRRADRPRRVRDRRLRVEHRARLSAPEDQRPTSSPARREGFNKMYGIVHPGEQWESNRNVRLSPFYEREQRARTRSSTRPSAGSGRTGTSRTRRCSRSTATGSRAARPNGSRAGGRRSSTPSTSPMRDRCGDDRPVSAFAIFDVTGPGALDAVQRIAMRQMDVPIGRVVYTPILTPSGGFKAGPDDHAPGRRHVPRRHRRRLRDVRQEVVRRPPARGRLGADPRPDQRLVHARAVGSACARHPRAASRATTSRTRASRSPAARTIEVGPLQVLASRISYVGDLGWELYVPIEQGARLWDMIAEAGEPHGIIPAGIGVYGTTGRLEKCYRAYGAELEGDFNVVEAGMAWGKVKDQDFIGKEAHVAPPRGGARGDHVHADRRRSHLEVRASSATCSAASRSSPATAQPLTDRKGRRSYVTQRRRRPVDRQAHPDELPAARARRGRRAARGRVHGRALSGDGGRPTTRRRCSTRRTRASL